VSVEDQRATTRSSRPTAPSQAAAHLRRQAILAGYAAWISSTLRSGLALMLDELARDVRELEPNVRVATLRGVRMLLGG
jgi:hypothetical protein